MNRVLLSFCCFVAILFFSKTNTQAQTPLYSKYDTLIIGAAGVAMSLTPSPTVAHNVSSDMATWAAVTKIGDKISVTITETNDTYVERIGHVYVNQSGTPTDTVVFIQPGKICQPGIESTAGKRFWVSFLENINGLDGALFKLELVAASTEGASGVITNPNTGYSSTFTVPANNTTSLPPTMFDLWNHAYNEEGETVSTKALYIETDKNITLYALNYEGLSSDAANILPVEALGDEYYSLSYNSNIGEGLDGNPATPEEFLIVATENNTLITILPTARTERGKTEGEPFLIKLQKGQSYLVKAYLGGTIENSNLYKSITGTYIKSNKLIAVFSGHKRAKIGCDGSNSRDNLYDQLRPVRLWGSRYAVISTGQPRDIYRVLAATDSTIIRINGAIQPRLNRTEYRDYEVSQNKYAFIESNHPISVAQFGISKDCFGTTTNLGDPYILLLNPVENQITDITFTPFPSEVIVRHSVAIVVNKENKALTRLVNKTTGNTVSLNFTDMSGYDYSYVVADISPVTHSINNDKGFIAFAFGYGEAESYAYTAGARFNILPPPDLQLDTIYCQGATPVQFPDFLGNGDYKWYTSSDENEIGSSIIPIILTTDLGTYTYYISQIDGCNESPRKKIEIIIYPLPENPVLTPQSDTAFCEGESVDLVAQARDAIRYEWYKDNVLIVGVTGDTYTASETGNYYVKASGGGDCYAQSSSNEVSVFVRKNPLIPTIHPYPAPPYYYGADYRLNLSPTENGVRYRWYKDSVFIGELGISHFLPMLKDSDSGLYYVEAINEYCTVYSPDFILAPIEIPDLFIPNVFTPNGDGINDNFYILGLAAFPENELTVINKRGKLVYSKKYYDNSWDGEGQPDDIYYYYFKVISPEGEKTVHRGYVYIKREK